MITIVMASAPTYQVRTDGSHSGSQPHSANLGASHYKLALDLYPSVFGNFLPDKAFG